MHRRNIAERAIQTLKNHVIACLAGLPDDFLICKWDEIVSQMLLTMHHLQASYVVPHISAFAHHHHQFGYNQMPPAPMWCAVQFHVKLK